jgi:4-diphosphocytidyl-2-C-methyl-D-erythritol kinase
MMLRTIAPGKVNLSLFLGPTRADGRHELVTLLESVSLADSVVLEFTCGETEDAVLCPGVEGPNLAAAALAGLRDRGWAAPPVRVSIDKRIPVTAGMAGGSTDAAAVLRLARELGGTEPEWIAAVAVALGSDVSSQLTPGLWLGTGAGDVVVPAVPLAAHSLIIVPLPVALSTPDVYREADRLGLPRADADLALSHAALAAALEPEALLPARLLTNDLEPAARSLCPAIDDALEALRDAGAEVAFVCGSGPTCAGLWWGEDALITAGDAATRLAARFPGATAVAPVGADAGAVIRD